MAADDHFTYLEGNVFRTPLFGLQFVLNAKSESCLLLSTLSFPQTFLWWDYMGVDMFSVSDGMVNWVSPHFQSDALKSMLIIFAGIFRYCVQNHNHRLESIVSRRDT